MCLTLFINQSLHTGHINATLNYCERLPEKEQGLYDKRSDNGQATIKLSGVSHNRMCSDLSSLYGERILLGTPTVLALCVSVKERTD